MSRDEFLSILGRELSRMPAEERDKRLAYYDELFSDMMEDGMSEQEAAAQLGDPVLIARELMAEMPIGELIKTRVQPSGGWTTLSIVLIVLGAPLWLPLLIAAAAVIFSVFIVIWAVVIALIAVVLGLAVGTVILTVGGLVGRVVIPGMLLLGLALVSAGLCVLAGLGAVYLAKAVIVLSRAFFRWIKTLIAGRTQ